MNLLTLSKLEKSFGTSKLFDDVSFGIYKNDKIGLVGVNGAGKTTLFKLMLEQMPHDGGSIFKNKATAIGYMEQHSDYTSPKTLWDEVLEVYADVMEIEVKLADIAEDIHDSNGDLDALTRKQHALSEEFEALGGFTYKSRVRSALLGIGFAESELDTPFSKLSGGQKTRAMLCKILLSRANLLFLDEPTNHLDIQATEWLEGFLRDYDGAFIVISHDRYFLDRTTNKTFELENQRLTVYNGNYTRYLELKEEVRFAQERQYENTKREIKRIEGIITQQRQWNRERNIKTAESKQKVVDKLAQTLDKPLSEPGSIGFSFKTAYGGGNDVLICDNLSMAFGEKQLFRNADVFVKKEENVFLLGPNGCGKTTLFKIIMSQLEPISGTSKLGANIKPAYYDQTQAHLDDNNTVLDEVHDAYPKMTQTEVRNALALFLFCGDDVFKQISVLSGGEKARISLLKLMLSDANLLLLDEPTNHLDIHSREALESALSAYNGTLLIVSHDRYFINKLADKIYYMDSSGLKQYVGNYDYFVEKHNSSSAPEPQAAQSEAPAALDYKAQKQAESERRKRLSKLSRTEDEIAEAESSLAELKSKLELPEYASDHQKIIDLCYDIDALEQRLAELYELWEQLSEDE